MVPFSALLLTAVLAAVSAAQSTSVVTVKMPHVEGPSVLGSVVEVFPTATSYVLTCPTGTDSTECGIPAGLSVLSGPSTMSYRIEMDTSSTLNADCKFDPETMDCSVGYTMDGITSTTTMQVAISEIGANMHQTVTLTAGVEKLRAAAASTGAAPRITQNAVFLGAAALAGGAMLV
ncbi:hypothetical protein MFIFM68171_06865 [Madurella fahalii]|uniref:Uncharacterized protein n=1 Tax=Madurella fahalii TaxID=1157608 RepID=A0ABQ0GFV8_9PEZI